MEKVDGSKLEGSRAGFQEGREKTGGRKKGTPNKATRLMNEVLDMLNTRREELRGISIIDLLRIGATFVPKKIDSHITGNKDTQIIIVRPPEKEKNGSRDSRIETTVQG